MLANDPHLRYRVPGIWYLAHLKAPGLNVSGATLPGVPCVITGHNENIAWGVTNLSADVMDIYHEQLDDHTGRYVFQGKMEQAKLDQQVITVKDGKPIALNTWVTRHGPVFLQNGKAYSIQWSAAEGFGFPFLQTESSEKLERVSRGAEFILGTGSKFCLRGQGGQHRLSGDGRGAGSA